ncbi:unnamed protein product, partial [Prorocentrum cordatum]
CPGRLHFDQPGRALRADHARHRVRHHLHDAPGAPRRGLAPVQEGPHARAV